MSDRESASSDTQQNPKRKSQSSNAADKGRRAVKRRASKACQCCRSRKVRCNVVEHGAPCTNCRLDEVECIVTESKRKRRCVVPDAQNLARNVTQPVPREVKRTQSDNVLDGISNLSRVPVSIDRDQDEHVPHSLYRSHSDHLVNREPQVHRALSIANSAAASSGEPGSGSNTTADTPSVEVSGLDGQPSLPKPLPKYLKPLPPRLGQDEKEFLKKKNALVVPDDELRNELLRCYVEFIHPLTPLLELREFLRVIESGDGRGGRISLLLFHTVMFAASAFVDMAFLRRAGYTTRKEARKSFFQKARLLYDFDYDIDRFSLVQALLLMTSWYETPDDRKDTWHWMGLAISTAITIGLNRDPSRSVMEQQRKRQWKRIWWSCVTRDRAIAFGMQRAPRLKEEDFDVPMLTMDDFELEPVPASWACLPDDCRVARDVGMQRVTASLCIEHTKLSLCIGRVLYTHYSLSRSKTGAFEEESAPIEARREELLSWYAKLPMEVRLEPSSLPEYIHRGDYPIAVSKSLLHMLYYAVTSMLHRPLGLYSPQVHAIPGCNNSNVVVQDTLRQCAARITTFATHLLSHDLVRFLPTSGVTVLQPAITTNLIEIKSHDLETRRESLQSFCMNIQVMNRLRDCYPAADHHVDMVDAAIRRADISVASPFATGGSSSSSEEPEKKQLNRAMSSNGEERATCVEDLVGVGLRQNISWPVGPSRAITPPAETPVTSWLTDPFARKFEMFIGNTPPPSDRDGHNQAMDYISHKPINPSSNPTSVGFSGTGFTPRGHGNHGNAMLDSAFESFIKFDDFADKFTLDENEVLLAAQRGDGNSIGLSSSPGMHITEFPGPGIAGAIPSVNSSIDTVSPMQVVPGGGNGLGTDEGESMSRVRVAA